MNATSSAQLWRRSFGRISAPKVAGEPHLALQNSISRCFASAPSGYRNFYLAPKSISCIRSNVLHIHRTIHQNHSLINYDTKSCASKLSQTPFEDIAFGLDSLIAPTLTVEAHLRAGNVKLCTMLSSDPTLQSKESAEVYTYHQ